MDISGWIAFITAIVVFASGSYFATRETPRTPVVIEVLLILFATLVPDKSLGFWPGTFWVIDRQLAAGTRKRPALPLSPHQQTVYTLSCTALDRSTYQESTTVNLVPAYQER